MFHFLHQLVLTVAMTKEDRKKSLIHDREDVRIVELRRIPNRLVFLYLIETLEGIPKHEHINLSSFY